LFSQKLTLNHSNNAAEQPLHKLSDLVDSLSTYAKIKAAVSLLTGVLIWLGLSVMGVKYPVLWGLLAFLLNFIPTIGSIIAAFPVLLLALLSFDPVLLLMIIGLYLTVNILVGNFVEPIWMGGEVGLSTLIVFMSMVFWGWLFGPVGMLLSVPLTIAVKFHASTHPRTEWLAVLLSNKAEHIAFGTNSGVDDRGTK
jgi:predicted PurR-regulated permease PerM